ncbi:MAG: DUF29 domain-containing protein [Symploca sp. SIO3E6]|nr:DUF29 domain-containing protein [Caldora sp. SIO3E6]
MMTQATESKIQSHKQLYQQDFYLWIQATTRLLQEAKFSQLDLENLIEEMQAMGRREKRELRSRLIILLMHLLKWQYQPQKRTDSWLNTINEQRISLEELFEDSPSLKPLLPDIFAQCYQKARLKAVTETGLEVTSFPDDSPWNASETLDFEYLPE